MIKAVVFDCDGTLVDSEPHSWAAWKLVMQRHGVALSDDQIAQCTGLGYVDTYAFVSGVSDREIPAPEPLLEELLAALGESYAGGIHRFEDAVGAVADLAFEGIPLAVASSSHRARLDLTLRSADLTRYFDVTVAGDEVSGGKPRPDVYLRAAELLGVDPANCVAVEDSGPGARSAIAAGMRVIGVGRRHEDTEALLAAGAGVVPAIDAATIKLVLGV